jgi:sugar phosphate permease
MVGIVIGSMAGARVISSFTSGFFLHKVQVKILMGTGLITIGATILGFGMLHLITNSFEIGTIAIILRIVQGLAAGITLTVCFGTISSEYF